MPKMKVWWIPQVPGKSFDVPVETLEEASFLLDVLAAYDLFQYENRIKPDFANAGGLVVWDENRIRRMESGLTIQISHSDGIKRKDADKILLQFGYKRYSTWKTGVFGWIADFKRR